jgi:hypothetical protein
LREGERRKEREIDPVTRQEVEEQRGVSNQLSLGPTSCRLHYVVLKSVTTLRTKFPTHEPFRGQTPIIAKP